MSQARCPTTRGPTDGDDARSGDRPGGDRDRGVRGRTAAIPARTGHGTHLQGLGHLQASAWLAPLRPGDDRVGRAPQRRRQRPRDRAPRQPVPADLDGGCLLPEGPAQEAGADGLQPRPFRPVARRPHRARCRAGLPDRPGHLIPPAARRGEESRLEPERRADGKRVSVFGVEGRAGPGRAGGPSIPSGSGRRGRSTESPSNRRSTSTMRAARSGGSSRRPARTTASRARVPAPSN